jgi:4-carboxymuconolactone decarboxylase
MADAPDERMTKGIMTALELFPPQSSSTPAFQYPEEIKEDWNRFSISTVMGDVWGRPGLETRERCMVAIAVLAATNKPEQLESYITGALNVGITREEVCEIILQIAVYAGFPTAIQGFAVANKVFDRLDESAED